MEIKKIMLMNGASFRKGTSFYLHDQKSLSRTILEKAVEHYAIISICTSNDWKFKNLDKSP